MMNNFKMYKLIKEMNKCNAYLFFLPYQQKFLFQMVNQFIDLKISEGVTLTDDIWKIPDDKPSILL